MTEEAQNEPTRSPRPSVGQWAIALLIVLALVASLLMVFSDDLSMQATLAVIAALWAAVIGAVLVTKYRRQADTAENRTRDLRLVYELQLEREIAARRQYESDVESSIRQELADESNHELDELKAQVLALRSSLEQLLGAPLPESRVAIGVERPRELSAGLTGAPYADVADDHAAAERDFATTAPQTENGRHVPEEANEPTAAEMTEIIPVVTDDPEIEQEPEPESAPEPAPAQRRRYPQPPPMPRTPQRPQPQAQPQPQTGGHQRTAYGAGAYEPPSAPFRAQRGPHQPPQPQPPQPQPEAAVDDGAHASGRPASELLSRLREGAAGGAPTGGHRRRRD